MPDPDTDTDTEDEPWFSVRCAFAFEVDDQTTYEERITIWRAQSFDKAIEMAELEAADYAKVVDARYIGLAQAFHLGVEDRPLCSGDEVFSLMRDSRLGPNDYIERYFDTGEERQGSVE